MELWEETGILAARLTEVGVEVCLDTIFVEHLCVTDWDKKAVTLQEGETVDFMWVSRDELLRMKQDELVTKRMQKFVEDLRKD